MCPSFPASSSPRAWRAPWRRARPAAAASAPWRGAPPRRAAPARAPDERGKGKWQGLPEGEQSDKNMRTGLTLTGCAKSGIICSCRERETPRPPSEIEPANLIRAITLLTIG